LVGTKIVDVNMQSKEDRELYQASQKLFGLLITFGEALAYLLSGMYGPVGELGLVRSCLILAQLFFAGFMVLMLDELL
jgi:protein transport protein SEC61 subunit alpha